MSSLGAISEHGISDSGDVVAAIGFGSFTFQSGSISEYAISDGGDLLNAIPSEASGSMNIIFYRRKLRR